MSKFNMYCQASREASTELDYVDWISEIANTAGLEISETVGYQFLDCNATDEQKELMWNMVKTPLEMFIEVYENSLIPALVTLQLNIITMRRYDDAGYDDYNRDTESNYRYVLRGLDQNSDLYVLESEGEDNV